MDPKFVLSDGFVVDVETTAAGVDAESGRTWDAGANVYVLVGRDVVKAKWTEDFGPLPVKGDLITCNVAIRTWEMNGRSGMTVRLGQRHDGAAASGKAA
jgi:hypothetical protein